MYMRAKELIHNYINYKTNNNYTNSVLVVVHNINNKHNIYIYIYIYIHALVHVLVVYPLYREMVIVCCTANNSEHACTLR